MLKLIAITLAVFIVGCAAPVKRKVELQFPPVEYAK